MQKDYQIKDRLLSKGSIYNFYRTERAEGSNRFTYFEIEGNHVCINHYDEAFNASKEE